MTLPPCHPSSRLAVAPVQLPQPPGALFRCTPVESFPVVAVPSGATQRPIRPREEGYDRTD